MVRPLGSADAPGEAGVGGAILDGSRDRVADDLLVHELVLAQQLGVGRAVEHDVDEVAAAVLGEVEPEVRELALALAVGRNDAHDRDPRRLGGRVDRRLGHLEVGRARMAGDAAGLDHEPLTGARHAGRDLAAAEARRAGDQRAARAVEDREIPVPAAARGQPRRHPAELGRRDAALHEAAAIRGRVLAALAEGGAGAGDPAGEQLRRRGAGRQQGEHRRDPNCFSSRPCQGAPDATPLHLRDASATPRRARRGARRRRRTASAWS